MITISESKMNFGPFEEDSCYYIEKSALCQRIQNDVKMVEFLWVVAPNVLLVEAKSTVSNSKNEQDFSKNLDDVAEKMRNALSLFVAARLGRHSDFVADIPAALRQVDLKTAAFCFVLVIREHKKEWLPPVQDALCKKLRSVVKTWALSPTSIAVLNPDGARRFGLIP
jgi:hypothetical protein